MNVNKSAQQSAQSSFPDCSRDEWTKIAQSTLKGRTVDQLDRMHEDGFAIHALYSSELYKPSLSDDVSASAARHWVMAQYLEPCDDAKSLNKMMLDELAGGAEGLIFTAGQRIDLINEAMSDVMADAIVLSFDQPDDMKAAFDALTKIWGDQNVSSEQARGALGVTVNPSSWPVISAFMTNNGDELSKWPALRVMTINGSDAHRHGATVAQELGIILASFVMIMRQAEADGFVLSDIIRRLEINIAVDADLYGNIAKARALRHLLSRVCAAIDVDAGDLTSRLHGITSDRMLARLDPETNMLRSGTAMLSMALSGLGVITNRPHDWLTGSSALSRRIARNTHHLLADESQLNHIADPAQGSYFIDTLTNDISDKAWQLFQEIEREGGLPAAEANGLISAWFDAANAHRTALTNQGDEALLGVTIHPVQGANTLQPIKADGDVQRGGNHRPAFVWEALSASFAERNLRCLMLDHKGEQSAQSAKRWMDALGLEAAAISVDDSHDAIKQIAAAQPDLLIIGDDMTITDADLDGLTKKPVLKHAQAFKGDIISVMTNFLKLMDEGSL